jgi:hypothetical protein
MLRSLTLGIPVAVSVAVLGFAPSVRPPAGVPEREAHLQTPSAQAILGCVPFPAGGVMEEQPPSPGERCIERTHGDIRIDRIAMSEC